jgi:cobalt-zinc-cadmium efflux system membrane fusion protein
MTELETPTPKPRRILLLSLVLAAVLAGAGVIATTVFGVPLPFRSGSGAPTDPSATEPGRSATVELVEGTPDTIVIPESVRKALGIGPAVPAAPPSRTRPLLLPGSTALDPTRVMRVRTRFNAEVMELGQVQETSRIPAGSTVLREIRSGDTVRKGDVLAVVWSVDVGSKKSDLADAIVQLRLDEKRLAARLEGFKNGSIPEDTLNQTRRDVVTDRSAMDRAERTLRTWNVPENEIKAVRDEAEAAFLRDGKRDKEIERLWARSALVAPRDGTIVERNVGVGEYVADNTINLFVIADVSRLQVQANPPEDLLPTLLSLPPERMRWTVQTVGASALGGEIDEIGYLLDPSQHTAVVKGYIDNPKGRLRAGQYVTATIDLPPPADVVEVPLTALVDDGKLSFLFVQRDPTKEPFTLRRVVVSHRFEKTAFVRSRLTPEEKERTPDEIKRGLPAPEPFERGDLYLTTGALELRAALEDRLSKARAGR